MQATNLSPQHHAAATTGEDESPPDLQALPPLPSPLLRLQINDLSQSGCLRFLQTFDANQVLRMAVGAVIKLLYLHPQHSGKEIHEDGDGGNDDTNKDKKSKKVCRDDLPWPATRSITLIIIDDAHGVASTSGIDLDHNHKEIRLSSQYVQHVHTEAEKEERLRLPQQRQQPSGADGGSSAVMIDDASARSHLYREITGVLVHEMVHCWQWNGHGRAPGGLIEGIADWVRLKSGWGARHWPKVPCVGEGDDWDAGYERTAWFLDWLETVYGAGTVSRLNRVLGEVEYDEEKFWVECSGLGKTVHELFDEYKRALREENGGGGRGDADGGQIDDAVEEK